MKLEVRVPISPEPHFFRQVEYLWRSFVAAGGSTGSARFAVWVGGDCDPYDIAAAHEWSRGNVEWHWVDRERFRRESYYATGIERVTHETDADIVLLADADTLLVRGIDDLLEALVTQGAVAGVMAHVPPFLDLHRPDLTWKSVFAAVGMRLPPDRYQHTGWGGMFQDPAHRFGPPYLNYGAVFLPGHVLTLLGREYERQIVVAETAPINTFFKPQLGLTLAICKLNLPRLVVDIRYNFPNDEWADQRFQDDLADVRIIHYLREHVIGTRRGVWGNEQSFREFLARRDLKGSNEILRSTVAGLGASR